ncbi:MAG: MtrB/PioB family outer membrane beta-barrel protein [Steroidobacteraceae bacterium]
MAKAALRNVFGANCRATVLLTTRRVKARCARAPASGSPPSSLPRPVDYVTDSFDFGVRYTGAQLTARLGYEGSSKTARPTVR